jgi:maleylacetate reductase
MSSNPELSGQTTRRMETFTYSSLPVRVVFGHGTLADLPAELDRLCRSRALVLTTPQQEEDGEALGARIGPAFAGTFAGAAMHTPVHVTEQALEVLRSVQADCVISLGGGSTTGLGKALALRTGIDQICIPTTYAGSEMTPILGQTEGGRKTTLTDRAVLPETVIYDVDLTMTLPPALSATSGINAIAHAVEALYAKDRNPIVSLMAQEGIRALAASLPAIMRDPRDAESRGLALYGAWLCGLCLGSVGMALHHKLCHSVGGAFDLRHAETHTVLLPHAVAYNAHAAPDAMAAICRAIGSSNAAQGLFDLAGTLGAKRALRDLGMPHDGIDRATDIALEKPYWNPRPIERVAIRDLITRAYAGDRPHDDVAEAA